MLIIVLGSFERLTQADDRRDVSELGVADSLGDGQAGDRDSGQDIVPEQLKVVFREPFEYGDEVLQRLGEGLVVLEFLEGVVRE